MGLLLPRCVPLWSIALRGLEKFNDRSLTGWCWPISSFGGVADRTRKEASCYLAGAQQGMRE